MYYKSADRRLRLHFRPPPVICRVSFDVVYPLSNNLCSANTALAGSSMSIMYVHELAKTSRVHLDMSEYCSASSIVPTSHVLPATARNGHYP